MYLARTSRGLFPLIVLSPFFFCGGFAVPVFVKQPHVGSVCINMYVRRKIVSTDKRRIVHPPPCLHVHECSIDLGAGSRVLLDRTSRFFPLCRPLYFTYMYMYSVLVRVIYLMYIRVSVAAFGRSFQHVLRKNQCLFRVNAFCLFPAHMLKRRLLFKVCLEKGGSCRGSGVTRSRIIERGKMRGRR